MKQQIEKQAIESMACLLWHIPKNLHLNCYNDCMELSEILYEADYRKQSEKYLIKENGDVLPITHHSEWISVEDRLPESGASVLGYSEIVGDIRCYDICKGRCDSTLQWWSETGWATVDDLLVTHWMPLPEPPKMKGGAE